MTELKPRIHDKAMVWLCSCGHYYVPDLKLPGTPPYRYVERSTGYVEHYRASELSALCLSANCILTLLTGETGSRRNKPYH